MIKVPCKDCPDKGCGELHDSCEKFNEYRQKIEKMRSQQRSHNRYRALEIPKKHRLYRYRGYGSDE